MWKNTSILCLILIVNLISLTYGNYCETNPVIKQAFNLGRHVFLGETSSSIWKFDPDVRQINDQKLDIQSIFGKNSFDWADTAFTFNFDECDPFTKGQIYCEAINSAKDIVIAFGRRKEVSSDSRDSRRYGYLAFRGTDSQTLTSVNYEDYIAWGLKGSGSLSTDFWVHMSGDLYYESSIFLKSRDELIVSIFDSTTFGNPYSLLSRKLKSDGKWSEGWTELAKTGFRGIFEINGKVFGIDNTNTAYQFKWSDDKDISFDRISDLKTIFNCFGNSTLFEGLPPISTTTSTTTSATRTASTESLSTSELIKNISSTDEIQPKPETINYETIEVEILTNLTENSTLSEPQIKQKLEEQPEGRNDETTDWSAVFVVAILLLILVIVIAVIIIVRNKQKSRIVYMNTKTEESKSAEIPLNNNNKSLLHSKPTDV